MKIANPFQSFTNLWTYYGYFCKARRVQSDFAKAREAWNSIGGFNASTGKLLNFVNEHSLVLVEYATWTATDLDDQAIAMIRLILIDHRDTLETMIDRIRNGQNMTTTEMLAMTEVVSVVPNEYGDPMSVLFILSILYQTLLLLRKQKLPTPDTDTVPPEPVKRPVLNFIRKLFNNRQFA